MILAEYKDLARYKGLSENMDTAIAYLQQHDLRELVPGKNEVDGERVFINRFDYDTLPKEETFYEAHLQYIDVHLLLSGEECIDVADITRLQETDRDESTDFVGYAGKETCTVHMNPAQVLLVFPEDAHRVKIMDGAPSHVQKAVMKVKV